MAGLLIVGDGGQGKAVLDCAVQTGAFTRIAFLVTQEKADCVGFPCYLETAENLARLRARYACIAVALGDNALRLQKFRALRESGYRLPALLHPEASVSPFAQIGEGTVVLAHAVVNAFACVGEACIINTGAIVEHDCRLAPGVHISPGACLGGGVYVGEKSWICLGSSVRNGLRIGKNVTVAAGAAVIRDVADGQLVAGVPAMPKNKKPKE